MTSDLLPEQSGLLVKKLLSDSDGRAEDPPRDADLVELRVDGAGAFATAARPDPIREVRIFLERV